MGNYRYDFSKNKTQYDDNHSSRSTLPNDALAIVDCFIWIVTHDRFKVSHLDCSTSYVTFKVNTECIGRAAFKIQ